MADQSLVQFQNSSGQPQTVSNSNPLPITGSSETQYVDGAAAPTHPTGNALEYNNAGTWQTVDSTHGLPSQVLSLPALPAGSNAIGAVTANAGTNLNTSALALETGGNLATIAGAVASSKMQNNLAQVGGTTTDTNSGNKSAGTLRVVLATDQPTMSNAQPVSQNGTWTVQPGNTPNTTAWLMQDVVASSNGAVPYHNLTAASTNFTNVKGAATQLYGVDLSNTSGSAIFVKLYDKATTPGTGDVPKRTWQVPANGTLARVFPKGLKFTNGFGWAATGAVADNDNTAIAANCVVDFDLNS